MNLTLQREPSTLRSTPGKLYVDGVFSCYTLEDVVREKRNEDGSLIEVAQWKIPGQTAIPSGRYPVVIDFSQRFNRLMPHILDVPGFDGIRIHSGNLSSDTEGCILVGMLRNSFDEVLQSRMAFNPLFQKIQNAITMSECPLQNAKAVYIDIEPALIAQSFT